MNPSELPSPRATSDIVKLGQDIAIARKRRHFTQQRLAEGAGINVATVRRLEQGDAGVSLGVLAMVMLTLGESGRLGNLLDIAKDDIGLLTSINELPKRVRSIGRPRKVGSSSGPALSNKSNSEPEVW